MSSTGSLVGLPPPLPTSPPSDCISEHCSVVANSYSLLRAITAMNDSCPNNNQANNSTQFQFIQTYADLYNPVSKWNFDVEEYKRHMETIRQFTELDVTKSPSPPPPEYELWSALMQQLLRYCSSKPSCFDEKQMAAGI